MEELYLCHGFYAMDEEIAKTQKCIFDIAWEVAKPLKQLKN